MTKPNKQEFVSASKDANKQPTAEAGEGAVEAVLLCDCDKGNDPRYGDVLIATEDCVRTLYTSQTTATQAAVAAAVRKCVEIVKDELDARGRHYMVNGVKKAILASIPAEATAALEKICMEVAKRAAQDGRLNSTDDELRSIVTSVIEKGK